jgi:hypothetical protein
VLSHSCTLNNPDCCVGRWCRWRLAHFVHRLPRSSHEGVSRAQLESKHRIGRIPCCGSSARAISCPIRHPSPHPIQIRKAGGTKGSHVHPTKGVSHASLSGKGGFQVWWYACKTVERIARLDSISPALNSNSQSPPKHAARQIIRCATSPPSTAPGSAQTLCPLSLRHIAAIEQISASSVTPAQLCTCAAYPGKSVRFSGLLPKSSPPAPREKHCAS